MRKTRGHTSATSRMSWEGSSDRRQLIFQFLPPSRSGSFLKPLVGHTMRVYFVLGKRSSSSGGWESASGPRRGLDPRGVSQDGGAKPLVHHGSRFVDLL